MTKIATVTLNPAIDHTALIPNFQAGEVNRVAWEQIDPGGKGVNVASFLSAFGLSIVVSGFLGKDNAELFQNFFTQNGIQNNFVNIAGNTRVNIKIVDKANAQVTDINFPGQTPTQQDITLLYQAIDQLIPICDWFVLSGSIPAGVSRGIYRDLIDRLNANGKKTFLDASGESLRQGIEATPYAIKPNIHELEEVLGRKLVEESEIVEAAQQLITKGLGCVIVSRGADGAIFVDRHSIVRARPPQIEVVSTVGAGDAMLSGFIVGHDRGLSLSDCARLATACSIGALGQIGSRLPPPQTIESWMNQVSIDTQTNSFFETLSTR